MRRNTLDPSTLTVDLAILQDIYVERLAYVAVYRQQGKQVPPMNAKAERYARIIWHCRSKEVGHAFDDAARAIRELFDERVADIVPISPWGRDNSWIHWDLAKQLYYFLAMPREQLDSRYRIASVGVADPTTDTGIRDEIVHRHIGWEVEHSGNVAQWRHVVGVPDILENSENRSTIYPGRLSSAALVALGEALCAQRQLDH